jgi:hypothetical protein
LSHQGAQDTGAGVFDLSGVSSVTGGSGNDSFADDGQGDVFAGRGGNDTFNLLYGGHNTLVYQPLPSAPNDATGGNGADVVNGFTLGQFESTPNADRIDVSKLLLGYTPSSANGPAHYMNGVATIDAGDKITDYLSVSHAGGDTTINIDRDGAPARPTR